VKGLAFDVELSVLAVQRGALVAQVPVAWRHHPGSRIQLRKAALEMARDVRHFKKMARG
jgi:hypothetical protein